MLAVSTATRTDNLHVPQATREDRFLARSGTLRALFRGAAGKMLLTTKTEREVSQLPRRANGLETNAAQRSEFEPMRRELDKIRRDGYAMSMGTSMPGAAPLAIPLPVPREPAPMTLSLGRPMREIKSERERLVALLHDAVSNFRRAVESAR